MTELEKLRGKLDEVKVESDRLRQESYTAKGWKGKWREVKPILAETKEEHDELRRKVSKLEMGMEVDAKKRDEEIRKTTKSVSEVFKEECQRMSLFVHGLLVSCAKFFNPLQDTGGHAVAKDQHSERRHPGVEKRKEKIGRGH